MPTTEWRPIPTFPGYSVSETGHVRNDETGRFLTLLVNQSGTVNVGLTRNFVQYKRSVALLVANAFIEFRIHESFDTPVHLDGNRLNNNSWNLVWRPRWFAAKYIQQFQEASLAPERPVQEMETREKFYSHWEAAFRFGLLAKDVLLAAINQIEVWPTKQYFRLIDGKTDITSPRNHGL
jgi:hypothetical protein